MAIQIIGINASEGSLGMIIDVNVNANLSVNQSYVVPADRVFEGFVYGFNTSVFVDFNNSGINLSVPSPSTDRPLSTITLGPGSVITCRNSSSLQVKGVLLKNG